MTASHAVIIRRALISVSDKTGIVELAQALRELNVEILSTGGTARLLSENDIPVVEVSDHTGFPEMMDGRVKTLHPRIHGGILGRRGVDDEIMAAYAIPPIDLVAVNLYPFERTVARPGCDLATAVENIDIGGPALLRAAAKNHAAVTVVTDPADYSRIIEEMRINSGVVSEATRFALAVKAFALTARYDGAIANYLGGGNNGGFPRSYTVQYCKAQDMRYGENPHQKAAFYLETKPEEASVATALQMQGKALSYNNVADTDAALECVKSFERPACVIVKHANPCGAAVGETIRKAYERAFRTDPTSAFGGIIAFNRMLDAETAAAIIERQFVEVIVAPNVAEDARPVLAAKKNVRVLACGAWEPQRIPGWDYKRVVGGLLVQDRDLGNVTTEGLRVVTERTPTEPS